MAAIKNGEEVEEGHHLYYRNQFLGYPHDGNMSKHGNDIPYYIHINTSPPPDGKKCNCFSADCNGEAALGDVVFIEGTDVHLLHDYMMVALVYKMVGNTQHCQIGYVTVPFTQAYQIVNLSGIVSEVHDDDKHGKSATVTIHQAYGGNQVERTQRLFHV